MNVLIALILAQAMSPEAAPEAEFDYGAALEAWTACGVKAAEALPSGLPDQAKLKAMLDKACAEHRAAFETRMTRFIMIDGDPKNIAAPIAKEEAARAHDRLIWSLSDRLETRFLLGDGPLSKAWMACLKKPAADQKNACAKEEQRFSEANLKRLVEKGISEAKARPLHVNFVRRTRQRLANLRGVE